MPDSVSTHAASPVAGRGNQTQQGQFSYHTSPASLWPDFLLGQESQPLRVLLVDNDARMRSVIGQELNQDNRITLVSTASNLRDGKLAISRHEFDVLLLDFSLGDGVGFDLIKHMKMHRPSAEAIVMALVHPVARTKYISLRSVIRMIERAEGLERRPRLQ